MSMPVKHSSSPSPVRGTAALQLLVPAHQYGEGAP